MTPEEYELRKALRIERMRLRASKLSSEAEGRIARAREIGSHIPFGQPILSGHHSEKRHRADIARIDTNYRKGFALADEAKDLARRAERAEASSAVSSDDPAAVLKLREKLAGLERDQTRMKAGNAAIRKKASVAEIARVTGLSEPNAAKLLEKDFAGRIGFPAYALTNLSSEIRRVKERIAHLEAVNIAPVKVTETIGEIRILQEENRVRMIFPGKPDEDTRKRLKGAGFRWSPTEGAWQRMASNQAWYHAREIAAKLAGQASTPSERPPPIVLTREPPVRFAVPAIQEIAPVREIAPPRAPRGPASARTLAMFDLGPGTPPAPKPSKRKPKAQTDWLSVFGIKK